MDCLDRVSRRCSLLINIDKTKVMVSECIACRIVIQNEQLAQVNAFRYLDGECMTEFRTRLSEGQAIGASLQKIWKSHSIPISMKIRLMKAHWGLPFPGGKIAPWEGEILRGGGMAAHCKV